MIKQRKNHKNKGEGKYCNCTKTLRGLKNNA